MTRFFWPRMACLGKKYVAAALILASSGAAMATATYANTDLADDLAERGYPLSLSGSYLAAITANRSRDLGAAALYYDYALGADPDNIALVERAFLLKLADGKVEEASALTDLILKRDPVNRFARMTLGVVALKAKSYKKAAREFSKIAEGPLARLTGTLLHAWTLAGDENYAEAIELLDTLEGPSWYNTFLLYHSGLIAEAGGDIEFATKQLKAAHEADPNVLRTTEALARFQLRNGMEEKGRALVENLAQRLPNRPSVRALNTEMFSGKKPVPHITTALQGAMEVLYGLGSAIGREGGEEISYVYLNLASYLVPESALPRLILGELLEEDGQFQKAIENYKAIGKDSIYKINATMRMAFAFNSLEKLDDARAIMEVLIDREPDNLTAMSSYGNILRSHELYAEAREIYSKAINKIKDKNAIRNWSLYYSRGIANERTNRWDAAEKDFRQALKLSPDQPQVLNYLGYSFIDQGLNYDEALGMIKAAVRLRPNDAFIIDSLGWAYYKLKKYEEAVKHLERAVELRPQDPILNDHLGDAYWHVGRKLEAVFQWSHARDLDPLPKDLEKIVKKIENGYIEEKDG